MYLPFFLKINATLPRVGSMPAVHLLKDIMKLPFFSFLTIFIKYSNIDLLICTCDTLYIHERRQGGAN